MGLRPNDAAKKDVQMVLSKEECVPGMGQKPSDATKKDAQMVL